MQNQIGHKCNIFKQILKIVNYSGKRTNVAFKYMDFKVKNYLIQRLKLNAVVFNLDDSFKIIWSFFFIKFKKSCLLWMTPLNAILFPLNLTQLVGTMHNIYKGRGFEPRTSHLFTWKKVEFLATGLFDTKKTTICIYWFFSHFSKDSGSSLDNGI